MHHTHYDHQEESQLYLTGHDCANDNYEGCDDFSYIYCPSPAIRLHLIDLIMFYNDNF